MTREDTIRMAREAGIVFADHTVVGSEDNLLQDFAVLVAAAERKRIATVISEVSFAPWATIKQILALVERS